jgi:ketosteroid isomerase-like protein
MNMRGVPSWAGCADETSPFAHNIAASVVRNQDADVAFGAEIRKVCGMTEDDALRAANAAYYEAFAARDEAAMARIWADEDVACVHPGWPPLFGRDAVLASYRDIFRNPRQIDVESRDASLLRSGAEGRVVCIEKVGDALLVATNWFRRCDGLWRLVHHQASPLAMTPQSSQERSTLH